MRHWLILMTFLAACGSDETGTPTCPAGEIYNPIAGVCEPARMQNPTPDASLPDMTVGADMSSADAGADVEVDASVEPDVTCQKDADQDGHIAMECGGDDCDDNNGARSPSRPEICDEIDNNCNDIVNDGITCEFYAHSDTKLYRLDPFKKTLVEVADLPGLFDIDTHPDGTLYGLSPEYLYRFNAQTNAWSNLPQGLGADVGNANGMAIDSEGTVYITSDNKLYGADLTTGVAQFKGNMGGFYQSSGDCVVTKQDVLYMTSSHTPTDSLVFVDGLNAQTTQVGVTGVDSIWGLTAAWGRLWGVTSEGDLVEINQNTGAATRVHTFAASFYGAASTPDR